MQRRHLPITIVLVLMILASVSQAEPPKDRSDDTETTISSPVSQDESEQPGLSANAHAQVRVHVQVFEVSLTKLHRLGLDWDKVVGDLKTKPDANSQPTAVSGVIDDGRVDQILAMLNKNVWARTLVNKELTAASGQTVIYNAGEKLPIARKQPDGSVSMDYQYGRRIEIAPEILEHQIVRLAIQFQSADVAPNQTVRVGKETLPAIRKSTFTTRTEMPNGQTLMISGLVQVREETHVDGVPLVSSVPYVGTMFRTMKMDRNELAMLALIRPEIVRPDDGQ